MVEVFSVYLFVSIIATLFLASYVGTKGKTNYLILLSVECVLIGIMLFGYLMEINSTNLRSILFWDQVQFIAIPFISVIWLTIGLMYTGKFKGLLNWKMIIIYSIPILTFIFKLTDEYHHLFYSSYEMINNNGMYQFVIEKGPWNYVQTSFNVVAMVASVFLYFSEYRKQLTFTKSKFLFLLVASLVPFMGIALIQYDIGALSIDYITLFFPISVLLIFYAVFKYDFLEVKIIARETIFEESKDGMILLNNFNNVIDSNEEIKKFFSLMNISLRADTINKLLADNNELGIIFTSDETVKWEIESNGNIKNYEISSRFIKSNYDNIYAKLKTVRDVTELNIMQRNLEVQATTDELSGLNNRREFFKVGNTLVDQAERNELPLSVIMMDLDKFKNVNDTYGHGAGDNVIREFSDMIKIQFRKTDINCRLGGEEFAVILLYCKVEDAFNKAELLRKKVEEKEFSEEKIKITVSIGIATYSEEASSMEQMLKYADKALYKSKQTGRNLTTIYENETDLQ